MPKAIVSIIALAVLVWAADRAQASTIRNIGNHSAAEVEAACKKVGGSFQYDSGGYGCSKANCDGKGGMCVVGCDNNGDCKGQTPGRTVPKSVRGVLTGGGQLAQPDRPSSRPPRPGTVFGQGVLGGGILGGGSGFGSQAPAATGSPLGGAAPPRAQGGGRVN